MNIDMNGFYIMDDYIKIVSEKENSELNYIDEKARTHYTNR